MSRLRSGQIGEIQAEQWFLNNGWHMTRTQPAIAILGSKPGKHYGRLFTVRMVGRGGVPDYTGYHVLGGASVIEESGIAEYRAVEVKECADESMPASRLDKAQREFMKSLPGGCAFVGIFWIKTQIFTMHQFIDKGSYRIK